MALPLPSTVCVALAVAVVAGGCGSADDTSLRPLTGARTVQSTIRLTPKPRSAPAAAEHGPPSAMTGDAHRILVRTTDGDVTSTDLGRTWHDLPEALVPSGDAFAPIVLRNGLVISMRHGDRCDDLEFRRIGRRVRRARVPGCGVTSRVAFSTPRDGLVLPDSGTYDGDQPRAPVFATHDGGRSWRRLAAPSSCLDASVAGDEIWVACGQRVYRSADAGHSWVAHALPNRNLGDTPHSDGLTLNTVVATGSGRAVLQTYGTSVLVTSDGGAHWVQRWPVRRRLSRRAIFGS